MLPSSHAVLTALVVLTSAGSAWAQRQSARLVYVRAGTLAQCPGETEVRDAVAARLGYDPFDGTSPRTVTAVITKEQGSLHARVELRDPSGAAVGERELTSRTGDCAELAAAMELAISIAVDPRSASRPAGTAPEATPAEATEPITASQSAPSSQKDVARPPEATSDATRSRLRWRLGAQADAGYGTTPDVAIAPLIFAGLEVGRFSLRVDGRLFFPMSEDASPRGEVEGSLLAGAVAPCVKIGIGVGCGVVLIGRFHGEGHDVDVPLVSNEVYVASGLRLGLEVPIHGRFFLPLHAEGLAPLTRVELRLRDEIVWRSPVLTLSGLIGLGVEL